MKKRKIKTIKIVLLKHFRIQFEILFSDLNFPGRNLKEKKLCSRAASKTSLTELVFIKKIKKKCQYLLQNDHIGKSKDIDPIPKQSMASMWDLLSTNSCRIGRNLNT